MCLSYCCFDRYSEFLNEVSSSAQNNACAHQNGAKPELTITSVECKEGNSCISFHS